MSLMAKTSMTTHQSVNISMAEMGVEGALKIVDLLIKYRLVTFRLNMVLKNIIESMAQIIFR